jgi:hypothetical protein
VIEREGGRVFLKILSTLPDTTHPEQFVLGVRQAIQSFKPGEFMRQLHAESSERIGTEALAEQAKTNEIKGAAVRWETAGSVIGAILTDGRVLLPAAPLSEQIEPLWVKGF